MIKTDNTNFIERPIILLDLNYTLVENSALIKNIRPYQKKIIQEQYREWLINLIEGYYVIIVTARPDYQKGSTIKSIEEKLNGWMPNELYLQEENDVPPIAKEKLLNKYIFPKHGIKNRYLAIESNPKTKLMYQKYKIPSVSVYDEEGIELRKILNEI
jgi:hypothetical protein